VDLVRANAIVADISDGRHALGVAQHLVVVVGHAHEPGLVRMMFPNAAVVIFAIVRVRHLDLMRHERLHRQTFTFSEITLSFWLWFRRSGIQEPHQLAAAQVALRARFLALAPPVEQRARHDVHALLVRLDPASNALLNRHPRALVEVARLHRRVRDEIGVRPRTVRPLVPAHDVARAQVPAVPRLAPAGRVHVRLVIGGHVGVRFKLPPPPVLPCDLVRRDLVRGPVRRSRVQAESRGEVAVSAHQLRALVHLVRRPRQQGVLARVGRGAVFLVLRERLNVFGVRARRRMCRRSSHSSRRRRARVDRTARVQQHPRHKRFRCHRNV